ncbi:MAG: WecB/TagA/CpsF family glycosyltransferase [Chitinophagaceae bacterium]|nr:WecB/TagA/CpsF family glycosyltransferase [Chitinophagaceae bacterium]
MAVIKKKLFGVDYSLTDYEKASQLIVDCGLKHISYGVSALAVHGLIESYRNPVLLEKVNKIDLVVPDGQPIRWALNFFHKAKLKDRVYGPQLTLDVLKYANEKKMKLYLFGSSEETLRKFSSNINTWFPQIIICGVHTDRFRDATSAEDEADIQKINTSGANIVLVGRGCPRQEVWVSDHLGKVNAAMMAVGAAFDFHAGVVKQAPQWMQRSGFEWLYRLIKEPRRLWKRYLITNSIFIFLVIRKLIFPKWV